MRSFTYFFSCWLCKIHGYLLYLQYILIQSGQVAAAIWLVATILDQVGLRKWSKLWEKYREIQRLNLKEPGKKREHSFGYNRVSPCVPANPTSSHLKITPVSLKIIRCSGSLQKQHTVGAIPLAIVPNTLNIFHPFEVLWKTLIPWIFPIATPPWPGYLRPGIVSYFLAFPTRAWYAVSTG